MCQPLLASSPHLNPALLPVLRWGPCFLPSSWKYFSSPQCSPIPILIGKSQVTPAGEKAWLPSEPEHHQ